MSVLAMMIMKMTHGTCLMLLGSSMYTVPQQVLVSSRSSPSGVISVVCVWGFLRQLLVFLAAEQVGFCSVRFAYSTHICIYIYQDELFYSAGCSPPRHHSSS